VSMDDQQLHGELEKSYREVIERHRFWLAEYPKAHGERWEQMLKADLEAALVEAGVCDFLRHSVDVVEPNEDPSHGGPDLRCQKNGQRFYVETTCIKIDAATQESKMSHDGGESGSLKPLTRLIRNEASGKTAQCGKVSDAACLLAIGTVHLMASCWCFERNYVEMVLTSQPAITSAYDRARGEAVGEMYLSTNLENSAFIRKSKAEDELVETARRTISGLLLCGLGERPPTIRGVLHVDAVRPFARRLLPNVEFCRLREGYSTGTLQPEWV